MRFVNWQSVLTEHQAWTLRAFAAQPGIALTIISARDELAERRAQGWTPPDLTGLDVTALPGRGWFAFGRRVIRAHPDAHHLFCGLWTDRRLFVLLLYAWWFGRKLALMTEAYSDAAEGLLQDQSAVVGRTKVWLRKIGYRAAGLLLGRRISPLLAIGPKAVTQFAQAGFRPQAICPFGYFVARLAETTDAQPVRSGAGLRFAFVGSLIRRKGLDIALHAMAALPGDDCEVKLDIYGAGDSSAVPMSNPRIRYCGVIPFGKAQHVLAGYDALIVPSRFDGWSVVVNEALLQGVPVLVSSAAGAADMVRKQHSGFVFDPSHPEQLTALIRRIAKDPALLASARVAALAMRDRLAPEVAAQYMLDCFDALAHGRLPPACPWY